jgi:hypothetical protein
LHGYHATWRLSAYRLGPAVLAGIVNLLSLFHFTSAECKHWANIEVVFFLAVKSEFSRGMVD